MSKSYRNKDFYEDLAYEAEQGHVVPTYKGKKKKKPFDKKMEVQAQMRAAQAERDRLAAEFSAMSGSDIKDF